jgi:hypothetical protein
MAVSRSTKVMTLQPKPVLIFIELPLTKLSTVHSYQLNAETRVAGRSEAHSTSFENPWKVQP